MKTMRNASQLVAFLTAASLFGCAPTLPPKDLVNARNTYGRVSKGPAQQFNPADMYTAKEQLNRAEAAFKREGDTQTTRDEAYLARRKAELAEVIARTRQATKNRENIVRAMHADEKKALSRTSAELSRTKVALKDEKERRKDAEKRAAQMALDLAKFATVKQEPRGMVITLSGSVLFVTAKSELLPTAQMSLNRVAEALTKEDPLSKIVVEGHTDSQGNATYNQGLSQRRAQAVRDYLVSRGIASDRITAEGFGLTRPIANNSSPEGRANNRRVEIVVLPTPSSE